VVGAGSETTKGLYTVLKDLKPIKMPLSTKTLLLGGKESEKSVFQLGQPYAKVIAPLVYDGVRQGTQDGGRNGAMTKYAGALHARMHQSLWDNVAWQMFEEANNRNTPPLSDRDLRKIWNSIGKREESTHPGGRVFVLGEKKHQVWGPEAPITVEKSKDPSLEKVVDKDFDPNETLHISEVAEMQKIDSTSTYAINMPVIDSALLGGFSAGDLIIVAGLSGDGKTTLVQDWTTTLAMGGVDKYQRLPTLWFSYEVLARPLWEKFQKIGADKNTPIFMPCVMDSGEMSWVTEVIEQSIIMWGIKVVAIDHLGFLRPPKGNYANAADSITHTVRALKQLAVRHGLIIILPVHVRKTMSKVPDLNDIKESSGIFQEADSVFFIAREKDQLGLPTNRAVLSLVKNRKTGLSVRANLDHSFGRFFFSSDQKPKIEAPKRAFGRPYGEDF
jgi:hypothetical protein